MTSRRVPAVLCILAALLGTSTAMCSRTVEPPAADAAALTTHSATGIVRAVDAEKKTVLIAHEEIPGYMKAMTMQFDLRDRAQASGLATGDKVDFTFTDDGHGHIVVQSIRKVAP